MEVIRAWISSLSDGSLRDFTLPTEGLVIEVANMPIQPHASIRVKYIIMHCNR